MYNRNAVFLIAEKGTSAALEEIKKAPVLIGLHDYIKEVVSQAVSTFTQRTTSSISRLSNRFYPILSASTAQEDRRDLVSKAEGDTFLKQLKEFARYVRIQNEHPLVSLEVQTTPTGALFSMHPKSYRPLKYETGTNGKVISVWIGRYAFSIKRRNFEGVADDSELDLVGDRRPILRCRLNPEGTEKSLCVRE